MPMNESEQDYPDDGSLDSTIQEMRNELYQPTLSGVEFDGYPRLNRAYEGGLPHGVHVVATQQGMNSNVLNLNLALRALSHNPQMTVSVILSRMSRDIWWEHALSFFTGLSLDDIQGSLGQSSTAVRQRVQDAQRYLERMDLRIHEGNHDIDHIQDIIARDAKGTKKYHYLALIEDFSAILPIDTPSASDRNHHLMIQLKHLTNTKKVTVLGSMPLNPRLSRLHRKAPRFDQGIPIFDISGEEAIEQAADSILTYQANKGDIMVRDLDLLKYRLGEGHKQLRMRFHAKNGSLSESHDR